MSQMQTENIAIYLHRYLPAQGFKLIFGKNSVHVATHLAELGHSVICLLEEDEAGAEWLRPCQGLRTVRGSLLNIPYHDFLQSIIIINALENITPLHWHALPEVFARALQAGGTVFMGASREPGRFALFRDIDRLMRESRFIRPHQAQIHFDIPELEDLMGAWWEKWNPETQDEATNHLM